MYANSAQKILTCGVTIYFIPPLKLYFKKYYRDEITSAIAFNAFSNAALNSHSELYIERYNGDFNVECFNKKQKKS